MQPSVLIGLIAKLTGSALQDDIAYYGDRSICRRLAMDETALQKARQELVRLDLIAWQRQLYQVLAIDSVSKPRPRGNLQSLAQVLQQFFTDFVPAAIDAWLHKDSAVTYAPYLMGSRYSLVPLKAGFSGLTKETTREELIAAVVRGLCEYQREHLEEISLKVHFKGEIRVSGEAVNSSLIRAKRKWMRNCDYTLEKDSSLRGAAMLGQKFFAK